MEKVSIIIPAYNEEKRISSSLIEIEKYMTSKKYTYEIIVVDDGSKDNTINIVKKTCPKAIILKNKINKGKGYSVSKGILAAKYPLILFSDSDLATPIKELEKLIIKINEGFDIAIASRNMKESIREVKQSRFRQTLGQIFPKIVNVLIVRKIKDTQCGFKLFKSGVGKKIASLSKINRFAFDVEYLFIANLLKYKVAEVPVIWIDKEGTTVDPVKDSIRMLNELLKIHYYRLSGKYNFKNL